MRPSLTILAVLPLAVVGDDALCARSGLLVDVVNEEWTPNGRPDGPRKARPWAYTTSDTYSGAWLQTVERFVEDDEIGVMDQCVGYLHALPHALAVLS